MMNIFWEFIQDNKKKLIIIVITIVILLFVVFKLNKVENNNKSEVEGPPIVELTEEDKMMQHNMEVYENNDIVENEVIITESFAN